MITTPRTTETLADIFAREFAVFELQEAEMKASERRERALALGLPLSLAVGIRARDTAAPDQPSLSPPSTGA